MSLKERSLTEKKGSSKGGFVHGTGASKVSGEVVSILVTVRVSWARVYGKER